MQPTFHGSFNARWVSPEEVARQFIPINQFHRLIHTQHSLLLGPRGSGKTTLLKMLTTRALDVWEEERVENQTSPFARPQFEALYVPSDIRWSYEIGDIEADPNFTGGTAELAQRAFVTASALVSACETFASLLDKHGWNEREEELSGGLIDLYGLERTFPILRDVLATVEAITGTLRGVINWRDEEVLRSALEKLPKIFFAHVTDGPIAACRVFDGVTGRGRDSRWALCFDELELAPRWMQREILNSLRSVDQGFLFKVTFGPVLPRSLNIRAEAAQDYQQIRLWNSHVGDARHFCEALAAGFLARRFPDQSVSADDFLRFSALAADDVEPPEKEKPYSRDSIFYRQLLDLARDEASLRDLLRAHRIDPEDPFTEDVQTRDTFLRKIKPTVILRSTFKGPRRARSRKVITAYAGKQAVFAMSEGNPRWLLGLLSDLYDRWLLGKRESDGTPLILYNEQAKVLNAAARRYHASLAAIATEDAEISDVVSLSLVGVVDAVGEAMSGGFLGPRFPLDPPGSFHVDAGASDSLQMVLAKGLETGAIVFIGASAEDTPTTILQSRFRLSFMLAPLYRLPFRNYRAVGLTALLSGVNPEQVDLFGGNQIE